LADWYRAADLFVLPTTAYEGFGMATVEALASGTPAVGTAIGATPEVLGPLDRGSSRRRPTPARSPRRSLRRSTSRSTDEFATRSRAYVEERFALGSAIGAWEKALEEACR
jgi:glycosyltransferase involved in cell wall biosynthesis